MKKRIIVIDDIEATLYAIEQEIDNDERDVSLCKTIQEAESEIEQMGGSDFILLDMRIGENQDDISNLEVERLKQKCPGVRIAIITGDLEVTKDQIEKIGADRLFTKPIDWQALQQFLSPVDVSDNALKRLRKDLKTSDNFLLQVIGRMNIGVSIMDAERNLLYVNKAQKDISRGDTMQYGTPCYRSFSPGADGFCQDCPITRNEIVTHARPRGFYDMQCIPLTENGKTIAYAKLSTEVTEKTRLLGLFGKKPLKETIDGILKGIRARGFSRVRMHMVSEGGKYLIGYHGIGHRDLDFIGRPIPISSLRSIKETLEQGVPIIHERKAGLDDVWLTFRHKEPLDQVGDYPILAKDGTRLGLVAVDNFDEGFPDIIRARIRPINQDAFESVAAFSGLIGSAIETDLIRRKDEIEKILIESDTEIYNQKSLQAMLQVLIEKVIKVVNHYWSYAFREDDPEFVVTGHIMKNRGKWLERIAGKGILYENNIRNANLEKDFRRPRVRVFNSGHDMITHHINRDQMWIELLEQLKADRDLPETSLDYYKKMQSLCCILIKLGDEKFGTMTIQSLKPYIFNDYIVRIIRGFVSKCSQPLKGLHLLDAQKHLTQSMQGITKAIDHLLRNRENEDQLIWTMLTALTHHDGLAYNRAIYFDCFNEKQCIAKYAVGPLDEADVEFKYKTLRSQDISLDVAIRDASRMNSGLTDHVKGKLLDGALFGSNPEVVNLQQISGDFMPLAKESVTISLSFDGKSYGALLVDNCVTGIEPSQKDKDILRLAGDIFSLVIHNFRYKIYEDELLTMIFHRLRTDIAGPFNMIDTVLKDDTPDLLDLPLMRDKLYEAVVNSMDLFYYSMFAKSTPFTGTVEKYALNLCELVKPLVNQLLFKNRQIMIEINEDLSVLGERNMLKHAIMNLIDNAIKYSTDNSAIRIWARQEDGNVSISVLSTPMAHVPETDLEKYFQKFQKCSDSEGAGIGLYVVKRIAEVHGGMVIARLASNDIVFEICIPEGSQ